MEYVLGITIGYLLRPVIDVGVKIFKNAWIEYKNQ